MRAERGLKNPVVYGVLIHACVFMVILAATALIARSLDQNLVVVVVASVVPATIILLVSLGLWSAAAKARTRHRIVVSMNPGASVVSAEWSSAVLAPFLKTPSETSSNYRGFGVEIAASKSGATLWRSRGSNNVELLGGFDWSQVDSIEPGTVVAAIGRRVAPTIRLRLHPVADSPFTDEIELLVRKTPVDRAVAALQAESNQRSGRE